MIKIIKATIKHTELIVELGKNTFLESHGNSASKEDINQFILNNYNISVINKDLENTNNQYFIIYFNNEVAGFSKIELNVSNKNINNLNITKLHKLYLLKEFYRKNLGSKLFDFNIDVSKKNNQKGIWLAVWVENQKAISFYTKKGFKIVGKFDFKISETHSNPNHIMYFKY